MTEISSNNNGSIPLLNFQPKRQRQCFMCCESNGENLVPTSEPISGRFCVLISRFLDFNMDNYNNYQRTLNKNQDPLEFESGEENGLLICCRKCIPIIESFCVDYNQFCKLRLELSCDLRRISSRLKSSINCNNNNKKDNLDHEEEKENREGFQGQFLTQYFKFKESA